MPQLSTTTGTPYALFGAEKTYEMLSRIGYQMVDYGAPCDLYHYREGLFLLPEDEFDAFFARDYALSERYHLPAGQTHAPFPTWPESNDADEYEFMMRALEKSLRASAIMHSPYMVMHCAMPMGWNPDSDMARTRTENERIFARLLPVAEKYGVKIALENMPMKHIPSCVPEQLIDYIDMMHSDFLVGCLDTGHANLSGLNCAEYARKMGSRLKVLHLHDNEYGRIYRRESEMDQHTCPFIGNVDWKALFAALCEIGYEGTLSLESGSFHNHFPDELFEVTEQFQHDILQGMVKLYWHAS